jgi:hypothetical protein
VTTGADRRSVLTGLGALGLAGCVEGSEIGGTRDFSAARREAVIADATRLTRSVLGRA